MKSSIGMKSWKTTISLSVLLFLILAPTVLTWFFIDVSVPSSLARVSTTSSANGSIAYDTGTNVITISGYSLGAPCTFTDVYNADVASGWEVVAMQGTSQFILNCKLVVGNWGTATYFADTDKQVTFLDGLAPSHDILIYVTSSATLTFGILVNATSKTTKTGVSLIDQTSSSYHTLIGVYGSGHGYFYSSNFRQTADTTAFIDGADKVYNSLFDGAVSLTQDTGADFFNLIFTDTRYFQVNGNGASVSNVYLMGTSKYVRFYSSGVVCNLYGRGATESTSIWFSNAITGYLVNADLDKWLILWSASGVLYRQYEFDLIVQDDAGGPIENATVILTDKDCNTIFNEKTDENGQIGTQIVTRGYYQQSTDNTLHDASPHTLTIKADGYQTVTQVFTLSQKTNWTIALQPLAGSGWIMHERFVPIDPGLTSPSGTYRWLDAADQAYSLTYRNSYNYSQATVEVAYCTEGDKLQGLLTTRNLKPNFAYQLKLVGTPGTADNERIGLVGRWWQEEWSGTTWTNGQNLNDKGDGSSPNPNDQTYLSRRYIQDSSSPTGYHYRYTGYLVFDYFITDSNGTTTLQFETGSCYHVIWKLTQRSNATNDGPVKTVTFDPVLSQPAYDTDYPRNTVSIFGEWERLPMSQVNLQPGEYNCQILLTEESFHGSGGTLAGNWAGAVTTNIMFTID